MRTAQTAPLYECVPPQLHSGTERIVSFLTEELVRRGHDVPLLASGGFTLQRRNDQQAALCRRPSIGNSGERLASEEECAVRE